MNAKIDEPIVVSTDFRYKDILIEYDDWDKKYSWSMERNHRITGNVDYVFSGSGKMATQFKTKNCAKRNLIKYCKECFED